MFPRFTIKILFLCGILLLKGEKNFNSEYYRSLAVTKINNKCGAVIGYYLIDRLGFRLWTMNSEPVTSLNKFSFMDLLHRC